MDATTKHDYMTSTQVSEMLGGMSRSTLIKNTKLKVLPYPVRLGGMLLWKRTELLEALENNRENFADTT